MDSAKVFLVMIVL